MPTYEYNCPSCGSFTAVRPMAQYREPQSCPKCAALSPRITLNTPALGGLFNAGRSATEGSRTLQSCAHPGGCRCC